MQRKKAHDLWSDSPYERLAAARALSASQADVVRKEIAQDAPMNPWPYGMPTVVNPFLVMLGMSPGASPQVGDTGASYDRPTVGHAHPGFSYEDSRGYWNKVRELSVGVLQGFDKRLNKLDCYALTGQMNLSSAMSASASDVNIDIKYARWVSNVLMVRLRPRVLILLGVASQLKKKRSKIREVIASSELSELDWNRPHEVIPFEEYKVKQYQFSIWNLRRPDAKPTTVISWPNHPSRSPMTNMDYWRASVREATHYLVKRGD